DSTRRSDTHCGPRSARARGTLHLGDRCARKTYGLQSKWIRFKDCLQQSQACARNRSMNFSHRISEIERKGPMNRRRIKISWLALSSAILVFLLWVHFPSLAAPTNDTATLTVRVTGARNTKGKIWVTVFQDAQGFPDDPSKAVRQEIVDIDPNTMSPQVPLKALPQGTFAV